MKKIVICVLSTACYFSLLLPLFCAAEQNNILLMIPPIIAGTHDNVETPDLPPDVIPFSYPGNWIGTFTGTDTGTWDVMVDDKGSITGGGYSNDLRSKFYLKGTVDTQNNFHAKAITAGGASTGAEFDGTVIEPGTVTGTWINKKYTSESGTFTGGLKTVEECITCCEFSTTNCRAISTETGEEIFIGGFSIDMNNSGCLDCTTEWAITHASKTCITSFEVSDVRPCD